MGEPVVRTFALEIRNSVLKNVTDPAEITRQIVFKTLRRIGMNALSSQLGLGAGWEEQFAQAWGSLKEKFR